MDILSGMIWGAESLWRFRVGQNSAGEKLLSILIEGFSTPFLLAVLKLLAVE